MAVIAPKRTNYRQVEAYLVHTGWIEAGRFDDGLGSVWHRPDSSTAEVVLPLEPSSQDFDERLLDALNAIANYEGEALPLVAAAVHDFNSDVVSVRVVYGDVEDGSIPLDEGVELNEHARDMMLAAAMSTVQRKRLFLGSRPDLANTYMKTLRLGQTSIGSYVVNVIAPISVNSNELESQRPFARVVTENLSDSLNALSDAATLYAESSDLSVFDNTVERGVSANMCEAVLGMAGRNGQRKVAVSVVAAPVVPHVLTSLPIQFEPAQFEAIKAAVEYLKGDYWLLDRTIRGYVKRLDREHGDVEGSVYITAVLFGKNEKNVSVALSAPEYVEAIRAHDKGLLVEVHGDIYVTPRTATLLKASGFRVFENGNLF
ncbi:MAG: hypothetical protein U1C47_03620 [Hydrogenophaga sp.]|nr:hypothetical protein [Hydrogenophaga sp.]